MNLSKIQFSVRERTILVAILFASLLAYKVTWWNKFSLEENNLESQIALVESKIVTQQAMLAKITSEKKSQAANPTVEKKVTKAFVNTASSFSDLVQTLGTNTEGENIQVNRIAVEESEVVSGLNKRLFSLELESSFIEIGRFLEKLDKSELLTEVQSVELSRISNDLKKCTAKIYVYGYNNVTAGDSNASH